MIRRPRYDYDLLVLGSGAAGSTAALVAARADKKVGLIEADIFGGGAPNWGDIPIKTLMGVAQLYNRIQRGHQFGLDTSRVDFDYPAIQHWKNTVVERTGAGDNEHYYNQQGIDTFYGKGVLRDQHTVTIGDHEVTAGHILIATGAHVTQPAIAGIETIDWLTPRTALKLSRPPRSLLIIGATTVAIELAHFFATFGSTVSVAEQSSRILPTEDEEVSEAVSSLLQRDQPLSVLTQTTIRSLMRGPSGNVIVQYIRGGIERTMEVERVLVATKPEPTIDIGLDNAEVTYSPDGGVEVNQFFQTNVRHIYAAGHVLGNDVPTHTVLSEGRLTAHNILHPKSQMTLDYELVPRATFIYPEVASVGFNEDDCIKRDLKINKVLVPLGMIARSNTSDFREGFVKLISDKQGVLLGGTIVAPRASELIQEVTLAIKHDLTAEQLAELPHVFLTWSEAVRTAASKLSRK